MSDSSEGLPEITVLEVVGDDEEEELAESPGASAASATAAADSKPPSPFATPQDNPDDVAVVSGQSRFVAPARKAPLGPPPPPLDDDGIDQGSVKTEISAAALPNPAFADPLDNDANGENEPPASATTPARRNGAPALPQPFVNSQAPDSTGEPEAFRAPMFKQPGGFSTQPASSDDAEASAHKPQAPKPRSPLPPTAAGSPPGDATVPDYKVLQDAPVARSAPTPKPIPAPTPRIPARAPLPPPAVPRSPNPAGVNRARSDDRKTDPSATPFSTAAAQADATLSTAPVASPAAAPETTRESGETPTAKPTATTETAHELDAGLVASPTAVTQTVKALAAEPTAAPSTTAHSHPLDKDPPLVSSPAAPAAPAVPTDDTPLWQLDADAVDLGFDPLAPGTSETVALSTNDEPDARSDDALDPLDEDIEPRLNEADTAAHEPSEDQYEVTLSDADVSSEPALSLEPDLDDEGPTLPGTDTPGAEAAEPLFGALEEHAPPLPVSAEEPAPVAAGAAGFLPSDQTLDTLRRLAGHGVDPEAAHEALTAALRGAEHDPRALPDARAIALGIAKMLVRRGMHLPDLVDAILSDGE